MIDTYMDRTDAATGYRPAPSKPVDRDDPCYWQGQLYITPSAARAAEARAKLRRELLNDVADHRIEMRHTIKLGSVHSVFTADGKRKY